MKKGLGDDPLREMISGKKKPGKRDPGKKKAATVEKPEKKKPGSTTVTPGGLLRKSCYFTETEWEAVRKKAYEENRTCADVIREAVRSFLQL